MIDLAVVVLIISLLMMMMAFFSSIKGYKDDFIGFSILAFGAFILSFILLYNSENGEPIETNYLERNGVYEMVCQGKADGKNYVVLKYLGDDSVKIYEVGSPLNGKVFKAVKNDDGRVSLLPWSPSE